MNFIELGLSEKTVQAIEEYGIKEATTVQCDVIPSILQGKDVFTIAPSGCGKTMSYVFPLIDIISNKDGQNILIVTPDSEQSVLVSDRLSVFNKYHEINEATVKDADEDISDEANVIIGSPDLLVDLVENSKFDFSKTNILVVDDINLIKKNKQLNNLEKILAILPADKQNIVYTNRRSKETQSILEKILKAPEEIKVDKNKEQEAQNKPTHINKSQEANVESHIENKDTTDKKMEQSRRNNRKDKNKVENSKATKFSLAANPQRDDESVALAQKFKSFNGKTPEFILNKGILADDKDCSSCYIDNAKISSPY